MREKQATSQNQYHENNDVKNFCRGCGYRPENIQKIKDHLFNDLHVLDRNLDIGEIPKIAKFEATPEIANAWSRLAKGTHTPNDIILLKHEIVERRLMIIWGNRSYDRAHTEALKWFFPE